ncbi:MFS transporter [Paraburkholderia sp. BCC1884]|uniref:MFS transporter n=1 Tax=Paraburkholderia sp. BCC1884 TaxID=2562668 RepID=UPI0021B1F15F|nr:MFS transporter [Paraburkholderia sp. BCC1884]
MIHPHVYSANRLDRLPLSPFHWRLLWLIGAGIYLDNFDLTLGSSVSSALLKAGWSTLNLNALFGTLTFAGLTIGALVAGILGDRYGRRFSYQINLAIFGFASLIAALVPDMHWLSVTRFFMGLGLGAEIAISYGMLSEFIPPQYRGKLLALLCFFSGLAAFSSSFISLWVIPYVSWRWLFALAGVAAWVLWIMRKSLPESPRWLESQGRHAEAEAVLSRIESEIGKLVPLPDYSRAAPVVLPPASISILYSRDVIFRTMTGCLILITIGYSVYGLLNWLPTFFVTQGFDIVKSLTWITVMGAGAPVGCLIGALISDRVGRRPAIIASCLTTAALGMAYQHVTTPSALLSIGFCLVASIYVLGAVGQAAYVPELFATPYRLRGSAVCGTAGRLASAGCQFFVLWLFTVGGVTMVLYSVVALQLLLALTVWLSRIETTGKQLEKSESDHFNASPGAISSTLAGQTDQA